MKKTIKEWGLELLHYVVVFLAVSGAWLFGMAYLNINSCGYCPEGAYCAYCATSILPTWLFTLVVFIISDMLAHRYILGER